jgi:hypothetical protein
VLLSMVVGFSPPLTQHMNEDPPHPPPPLQLNHASLRQRLRGAVHTPRGRPPPEPGSSSATKRNATLPPGKAPLNIPCAWQGTDATVCLPACLPAYLPPFLPACLPVRLSACMPTCLPAFLPACVLACLPACLLACLTTYLPTYLPTCLPQISGAPCCYYCCYFLFLAIVCPLLPH